MLAQKPMSQLGTLMQLEECNEKRNYPCVTCGKSFKRSEHRARHQRAHTHERPFSCRFCSRKYARRDLVVRHEKTLHREHFKETGVNKTKSPPNQQTESLTADAQPQQSAISISPSSTNPCTELTMPEASQRAQQNSVGVVFQASNFGKELDAANEATIEMLIAEPSSNLLTATPVGLSTPNFDITSDTATNIPPLTGTLNNGNIFTPFESFSPSADLSFWKNMIPDINTFALPSPSQTDQGYLVQPGLLATNPGQSVKESLPRIARSDYVEPRIALFTEAHRDKYLAEFETHLSQERADDRTLPLPHVIRKLLRTFVRAYLIHFPFIHLPTLDLDITPIPLILAMCAIGALYQLEPELSSRFHFQAQKFVDLELAKIRQQQYAQRPYKHYEKPDSNDSRQTINPLWIAQTRLLLTFLGALTGNPIVVRAALENVGYLVIEYRNRTHQVACDSSFLESPQTNWHQWCNRETSKRLLHAIFIFCNLLTSAYGMSAVLSPSIDGDVELPCEEALWDAETELVWQQRISRAPTKKTISLYSSVSMLMSNKAMGTHQEDISWSRFAAVLTLHGVSLHIWHISQQMQINRSHGYQSYPAGSLDGLLQNFKASVLARCYEHITPTSNCDEQLWDETEGPLLFNCMSILRLIYIRAYMGVKIIDGMILLRTRASQIRAMLKDFILEDQIRSSFVTKAAIELFNGILLPTRAGRRLIQRTAALTWSIEIAICSWNSVLFFTKWLHAIEKLRARTSFVDDAENAAFEDIVSSCTEHNVLPKEYISMSASICRHFAPYYDDTWVYGITPRMGYVLRELAGIYEQDIKDQEMQTWIGLNQGFSDI